MRYLNVQQLRLPKALPDRMIFMMIKFRTKLRSLTVLLTLISNLVFAQGGIQVKVYQNTDFFSMHTYAFQPDGSKTTDHSDEVRFNRFSLAIAFSAKKEINHELEFFIPEFDKPIDKGQFPMDYLSNETAGFNNTVTSFSFRYEVNKTFNPGKRVHFNVGLALNPYYVKTKFNPSKNSDYIYREDQALGIALNLVPRIIYKVANRLYIDLNAPLKICDVQGELEYVDNPELPESMKKTQKASGEFFRSVYTVRLGVAYALK